MTGFIAKSVTNNNITEFLSTPIELATVLSPGPYDLKPIGEPTIRVNVLDVQNIAVPSLISGTAFPGNTLTWNSGTYAGVLANTSPYDYRLIDLSSGSPVIIPGATSVTFDIPLSGYEGKVIAFESRAQTVRGQYTSWYRSDPITITNITFGVANSEWTFEEDADDSETRQSYIALTLNNDLPSGKRPRAYSGPNSSGNPSQSFWLTGSNRNWIGDTTTTASLNTREYGVIYMQTDDGLGNGVGPIVQISSIKYFDPSNTPAKPNIPTVSQGSLQTGDVLFTPPGTLPSSRGRSITELGYSINDGSVIALNNGTSLSQRTINILSSTPVSLRFHCKNVNGWSVGSDPVTVTPPVIVGGTNAVPPTIGGSLYGGGLAIITPGEWTGSPVITRTVEQSDNGTSGWTTVATPIVETKAGDVWNTALAGKYLRVNETPSIGSPAYSAAVGPLGAAYSHVLSLGNNNNYATHTVTPPFLNATSTGGLWLGGIAYFDGTTWDAGGQGIFGMGQVSGTTNHVSVCGNSARINGGAASTVAGLPTPVTPGWYICVVYMVQSGSTKTCTFLRNDEVAQATTTTGTYTFSATQWNALRLGMTAQSSASNGGANMPIDCVFAGKGNPAAFVEWLYNGGNIRKPSGYNFAADPNGATMDLFMDFARIGAATFAEATDLIDSIGTYDTWTMTAPQGSFGWTARKPSFVMPSGDPLPVPIAYLSPAYGTTDDIFSIESGRFGGAASTPAWVTSKSYAVNQRVTQGGQTYRCLVAHTSGTFATDLSANLWGLFSITVNSLTHSTLGDIRGSLVGYAFTCATPGTITGNVTLNGTSVAISGEVRAARGIPANPQYASAFGGNGLVAAIEPYPTPDGAATNFASVSALATALSSLSAGATLVVGDLNDLNGATLTIPPRDYGGATIICKNWEGFKCAGITVAGVSNLTIVGFASKSAISGNQMGGNVTVDHCRASHIDVDGSNNELTFNFTFSNHLCWEAASGIPNGYTRFNRINRLTGLSWVMQEMQNAVAVFQMYKVGLIFMDRFYAWPGQYSGSTHPDIIQLTKNNAQGWTGGDIRNGMGFHRITTGAAGFQGLFLTDNAIRNLSIKRVIMDVSLKSAIVLSGTQWNVRIEDCTGLQMINVKSGYTDSCYVANCVMSEGDNYSNTQIVQTPSMGYETGNLGLTVAGLVRGDLWPQYATWLGNWRAFANPNTGYETRGAAAFVAELEAKRIALGL